MVGELDRKVFLEVMETRLYSVGLSLRGTRILPNSSFFCVREPVGEISEVPAFFTGICRISVYDPGYKERITRATREACAIKKVVPVYTYGDSIQNKLIRATRGLSMCLHIATGIA